MDPFDGPDLLHRPADEAAAHTRLNTGRPEPVARL
jgi:hypothetical protein